MPHFFSGWCDIEQPGLLRSSSLRGPGQPLRQIDIHLPLHSADSLHLQRKVTLCPTSFGRRVFSYPFFAQLRSVQFVARRKNKEDAAVVNSKVDVVDVVLGMMWKTAKPRCFQRFSCVDGDVDEPAGFPQNGGFFHRAPASPSRPSGPLWIVFHPRSHILGCQHDQSLLCIFIHTMQTYAATVFHKFHCLWMIFHNTYPQLVDNPKTGGSGAIFPPARNVMRAKVRVIPKLCNTCG